MEKKPKLLDKKRLLISCNENLINKIIEQAIRNISNLETIYEQDLTELLARVFMSEPKLIIIAKNDLDESLNFAKHIRNNPNFIDIPIICISQPLEKDSKTIKKKIINLKLHFYTIPINNFELTKVIKQFLEN